MLRWILTEGEWKEIGSKEFLLLVLIRIYWLKKNFWI